MAAIFGGGVVFVWPISVFKKSVLTVDRDFSLLSHG